MAQRLVRVRVRVRVRLTLTLTLTLTLSSAWRGEGQRAALHDVERLELCARPEELLPLGAAHDLARVKGV